MGKSKLELEQQVKNKNKVIETQIETLDEYRKTIKKLEFELRNLRVIDVDVELICDCGKTAFEEMEEGKTIHSACGRYF